MGGPAERQPCWVVLNTHCLPPTDGILPEWEYRVKERTQCTQGGRASEGSFPERGRHPFCSQDEMDSAPSTRRATILLRRGRREVSPQAPEEAEGAGLAVEEGFGAADELVADEEGKDVVAVLALRFRDVHFEAVAKVPKAPRRGRGRDGGDRVELQVAKTSHGTEDAGRAAVEELARMSMPRASSRETLDGSAGHGVTLPRRAVVREAAVE